MVSAHGHESVSVIIAASLRPNLASHFALSCRLSRFAPRSRQNRPAGLWLRNKRMQTSRNCIHTPRLNYSPLQATHPASQPASQKTHAQSLANRLDLAPRPRMTQLPLWLARLDIVPSSCAQNQRVAWSEQTMMTSTGMKVNLRQECMNIDRRSDLASEWTSLLHSALAFSSGWKVSSFYSHCTPSEVRVSL